MVATPRSPIVPPYKIHVLYEYGIELRPHTSAFVRLLCPLTHAAVRNQLEIVRSLTYDGQEVDAVIVERLWRPDISLTVATNLVDLIRQAGAKFIYTLDDNLLDVPIQENGWPTPEHFHTVEFFLNQADLVVVSTEMLRKRLVSLNSNIVVVPNALDERLLLPSPSQVNTVPTSSCLTIGYMGSVTHDDDLLMILPALQTIWQRYSGRIKFQLIGGVRHKQTFQAFGKLPIQIINLKQGIDYPSFLMWFVRQMRWDIALAPLKLTPFTRCKSDIKFLDYSAIGAAGIYSHVPVYEGSVRHLRTGWLAENHSEAWFEALDRLIIDAPLRKRVAQNATDYLYGERTLAQCAADWLGALETAIDSPSH